MIESDFKFLEIAFLPHAAATRSYNGITYQLSIITQRATIFLKTLNCSQSLSFEQINIV